MSFSLAYLIALIFPSIPLIPNPPGTKIPWDYFKSFHISSFSVFDESSKISASIHCILMLIEASIAAYSKALINEVYASLN